MSEEKREYKAKDANKDKDYGVKLSSNLRATSTAKPQKEYFTFVDSEGKEHRRARTLANGTIYDEETRKFLTSPTRPPFADRAKAREANAIRQERAREQAARGLLEAAKKKGLIVSSGAEAWGEVIAAMASTALEGGSRQAVRAAQLTGKAAGYLQDQRVEVDEQRVTARLDSDLVLLKMMNNIHEGDQEAALESYALFKDNPGEWLRRRGEQ